MKPKRTHADVLSELAGNFLVTIGEQKAEIERLTSRTLTIEAETREACAVIAESPLGLSRLCPYGRDKPGGPTWDHTDKDICPVCKADGDGALSKCTDNVGGRIATAIRAAGKDTA